MQSIFKVLLFLALWGLSSSYVILEDSTSASSVRTQQIFLYDSNNCRGSSLDYTNNSALEGVTKLSGFIIGMWRVDICPKSTPDYCETFVTVPSAAACRTFDTKEVADINVTRYGEGDTSLPHLSVFKEIQFLGTQYDISSKGISNISVESGNSFAFTGPLNWALYTEPNFKGNVTCIIPGPEIISNGYGITFSVASRTPLAFKSAKAGACEGEGAAPPTEPPPPSAAPQAFPSLFISLILLASGYLFKVSN